MIPKFEPQTEPVEPTVYQIRIKGHLDREWTDWFGGMSITLKSNGDTLLTGPVVDQAALFGVLNKVRDLGLPLLALNPVRSRREDVSASLCLDPNQKEKKNAHR